MIETHRSFCRFCHAVCGIEVDVEDGRVLAVRGDRDHVVSQGYLCVKGREPADPHTHPSRLRGPKRRTADGTFVDIASETAMDEVAMRLSALIARDGPRAIAVYCGPHGVFGPAEPPPHRLGDGHRHPLVLHAEHDRPAVAADGLGQTRRMGRRGAALRRRRRHALRRQQLGRLRVLARMAVRPTPTPARICASLPPHSRAEIYDYPGEYAQRFDGVDTGGRVGEPWGG